MRASLTKRVLPLTLCFAVGLGLAAAGASVRSAKRRGIDRQPVASETHGREAHSRTWLVIRSRPKANFSEAVAGNAFVHLRAKLGADGTVSEIEPISANVADGSVAEAVNAARLITFTPATEDGVPLSVLAEIRYDLGRMHATGVDGEGRRFCLTSVFPTEPSVKITSVPGATAAEGWRVIYE